MRKGYEVYGKKEKKAKKVLVAQYWLSGCGGCEVALLNMGRGLIPLYKDIEIVGLPLLEDRPIEPGLKIDYAIFTGAVSTGAHVELVKEVRAQSKVVIALGTCATHGGIPAMANRVGLDRAFSALCPGLEDQSPELPSLLSHLMAIDEVIQVDFLYPGCPPHPEWLKRFLKGLSQKGLEPYEGKSVCDQCHLRRTGHFEEKVIRRLLPGNYHSATDEAIGERCLLERGILCLGPVTISGCGAKGRPLCIQANVPCKGCYGPVPGCENQLLGLATILSTHGVDLGSLPDPGSMNRFIGAHGIYR